MNFSCRLLVAALDILVIAIMSVSMVGIFIGLLAFEGIVRMAHLFSKSVYRASRTD